jgi:phage tail sheath protein FI
MTTYRTPGVYVEEISVFPPSVAEVATAIPAFIGYTEKAKKLIDNDLLNIPTRISSLVEYEVYFGGAKEESFTVELVEDATAKTFVVNNAKRDDGGVFYRLYYGLKMYFANGGGPCYVVSVGSYGDTPDKGDDSSGLLGGLAEIKKEDEPTIIVFPDAVSLVKADYYEVMNAALDQCKMLQDRVAVMDIHNEDVDAFRDSISGDLACLKYGAAYHPWLETSLNFNYLDSSVKVKSHKLSTGADPDDAKNLTDKTLNADEIKGKNNVLYNQIKLDVNKLRVKLPPCCAIAGVYGRVDSDRGVWKAPANVSLNNVIQPSIKITNEEQAGLNIDVVAGKSVNAIRAFSGKGIMVWGARTLAGNDNEWRYVPVRRFFNMVEESVKKSTYWAVFEPNDANTWVKVRGMIENYLMQKWREGALAGATPKDAFFVRCGLGTTMNSQDILEGRMNVEIGMAAVRPAEFIILKFSHKLQTS